MSIQKITKQGIILVLSVFMLGLFIFGTYFYWVPDTLISFVPDNVLFYAHVNINKFHYSGYLAQKWLKANSKTIENIFKEYSINQNIIDSLDEIALFTLAEDDLSTSQLGLILRSKTNLKNLQDLLPSSCSIKQMSDKIFIVSSQIDLNRLENSIFPSEKNRFRFISLFNREPSLAQGYLNLELTSLYLPIKKKLLESKFVKFNILYSSFKSSKLFFETENKNSFNYSLLNFQEDNFSILKNSFNFFSVFSIEESLDNLENKIKIYLASQKPKERKVVLPDNSSFVELIVDSQDFIFKREGTIDYLQGFFSHKDQEFIDQNFEIAFFQDQKHTFFSNNHVLLKEIIPIEQREDSISSLYWEIDNSLLQRLVLHEKDQKIKGFLEFK